MISASFRSLPRPFVATIIQEGNVEDTTRCILEAQCDGSQGFMVDITNFEEKDVSKEALEHIAGITPCPKMLLTYRRNKMDGVHYTDQQRMKLMFRAAEAGFTACDLMGDLFDPSCRELTRDASAIKRQKELIHALHARGTEVLMSSHISEPLNAETVLEHLLRQEERGVDIAKIIVTCNTENEFEESIRTTRLLKEKLSIPFIHLCNGWFGRIQRYISPMLGSMLTFAISPDHRTNATPQSVPAVARQMLDDFLWKDG